MINNVVLVGRMTRDAELRYTPSNVAVATFSLAVNRNFKGANGERETDFINCVIWRQQAENLANWAKKGALIGITGRIQTRNYENQQGQRVYVTEVVADNFQMLESRAAREGHSGGSYNAGGCTGVLPAGGSPWRVCRNASQLEPERDDRGEAAGMGRDVAGGTYEDL